MMKPKVVCLGAGSLYFPRAIGDLVLREDMADAEIVLYDLDDAKAGKMAAMGRRLSGEAGKGVRVRAVKSLERALDGADFAISSIGGSGAEICSDVYHSYYHNCDMYIPARYGIQQVVGDTAGPAGLMMGLRSIPAYLQICSEMEKRCPGAILLSHSNPMAVLCRAMNKHSKIKVIGICHGVQATVAQAAEMLDVPAHELECVWIGTNHYYWILRASHRGRDLTETLSRRSAQLGKRGGSDLCHRLSSLYGYKVGYPGAGHLAEFYSWATRAPSQDDLAYNLAGEAREHGFDTALPMPKREKPTPALRRTFSRQYQDILDRVTLPSPDTDDAEGVAKMISAMRYGRREVFIVNIPNGSAVPNLPPHALLEIEGVTDSLGVRGITVGDCPRVLKGILEKRIAWQELVVDAAVLGDRNLALQALMLDEMALTPDKAEAMLEELLAASRDMLPRFFAKSRTRGFSCETRQH